MPLCPSEAADCVPVWIFVGAPAICTDVLLTCGTYAEAVGC